MKRVVHANFIDKIFLNMQLKILVTAKYRENVSINRNIEN